MFILIRPYQSRRRQLEERVLTSVCGQEADGRPRQVGCRSRGWLPRPPGRTPAPDGAARGRACLHDQRPQKSHLEACSPSAAAPVPRLRESLRSDRFSSVSIFGLIFFQKQHMFSLCGGDAHLILPSTTTSLRKDFDLGGPCPSLRVNTCGQTA